MITAEALTITAVTNSRTYDGTTSAAAQPVITSGSLQGSDTADFIETYSTQNVGTGLTLTPSGVVNDGNGGNNYTYTFVPVTTGVITAEALTITAVTNTKTYDGTTSAAMVPDITSGGLAPGDTADFVEMYNTPNVGTGLTLTPSGIVNDGNGGNNYTYTFLSIATGVITAEALTITAVANTKIYDGTTSAAALPEITSGSLQGSDVADFIEAYSTPNAGTGLTLTPSGTVEDGNGGNNYTYTFVPVSTGVITAEALTITAVTNTKMYDGTTSAAAVPTITSGSLQGSDVADFSEAYSSPQRGDGIDADAEWDGRRRQRREQLHVHVCAGRDGSDHGRGPDDHGGDQHQDLRWDDDRGGRAGDHFWELARQRHGRFCRDVQHARTPGTGLTLTPSGTVKDGNDGNNYTYTFMPVSTGVITAEALTITGVTNTKTYDGTTTAAALPVITSGSLQGSDTADFVDTYSTRNVGTGLTLTPSGVVNDGNGGNNYTYTFLSVATGVINAEALTITAVTNTKSYDGTTSAAAVPVITSGSLGSGRYGRLHRDVQHAATWAPV